jgi:hypothetical protein
VVGDSLGGEHGIVPRGAGGCGVRNEAGVVALLVSPEHIRQEYAAGIDGIDGDAGGGEQIDGGAEDVVEIANGDGAVVSVVWVALGGKELENQTRFLRPGMPAR